MTEPIQIQGSDTEAKVRTPLNVVLLAIVTFGVYFVFWYYYVNKEMAKFGAARNTDELGDSPGTSVLAVTLGAFIIVPAFLSVYHTWQRLNAAERLTGLTGMEAGLGFILQIFISPVGIYIFQENWNKVLQAQAGGGAPQQLQEPAQPQQAAAPQEPAQPQQPAAPQEPAQPQQPAAPQEPAQPQQPPSPEGQ